MGGVDCETFEEDPEEWEFTSTPTTVNPTLVLVGRTGNGKSATGNSILGSRIFKSKASSCGVTSTCEVQSVTLPDGRCIRVIDTPGLFDPSMPSDFIGKEIVKCIDLAKEGVHAILFVLSTRNRFTAEEVAAVESLQSLFGPKVVNYMIVIFTGGDELEESNEDLSDYLSADAPDSLLGLLKCCGDRKLLFDNKTKDGYKKEKQFSYLLQMIDRLLADNGGQPYSNELFLEAKERAIKYSVQKKELSSLDGYPIEEIKQLRIEMEQAHAEQLQQVMAMVEEKLRVNTAKLEERLAEEQRAREEVERRAHELKAQSNADIRILREALEKANLEREEFRKRFDESQSKRSQCIIL